jgi:hypothetical protein
MPKQLFYCRIDLEFPVVAESSKEAAQIAARKAASDLSDVMLVEQDFDVERAHPGIQYIPGGWEPDCQTLDGSMTLEEAWKLNKD